MLDSDTLVRYMNRTSPITIGVERRIRFVNDTYHSPCRKVLGEKDPKTNSTTSGVTTADASIVTMTTIVMIVLGVNHNNAIV